MKNLPETGARVGVKVHEWNALLASIIEEVGTGAIAIALPSDGRSEYDLPKGIAVDLEWATPRGLMRVRGHSAGPRDDEAILVELAGEPEVFQRRDYVRASATVDVRATPPIGGEPVPGLTIDLSGGGVQASLPGFGAGVDERFDIEILVPDEDAVPARVRVTRKPGQETFSLAFEQIDARDQERLIRYVFQRLRAAAKAA